MSKSASGKADSGTETADKESTVCPTCGKSDFKNRKYMKIHHANAHGESLKGEPVECSTCGKDFQKQPNQIEEYDNHFCSDECENGWRSEYMTGENSPAYKGGKDRFECANCGDKFEEYSNQVSNTDRPFCSRICNTEYWRGRERPELQKRAEVNCDTCNKTFEKRVCKLKRIENVYCSRECADTGHSENMKGEGNPKWNGGHINYYGPNWSEQRQKARERDGHTCQRCGVDKSNTDVSISVHHKTPFREFDDHEKANRLENLICLCRSCHGIVESWPVIPE